MKAPKTAFIIAGILLAIAIGIGFKKRALSNNGASAVQKTAANVPTMPELTKPKSVTTAKESNLQRLPAPDSERPKQFKLAPALSTGAFVPVENVERQILAIAKEKDLNDSQLEIVESCYNDFVHDVRLLEASIATIQPRGANTWQISIPGYHEEGVAAVERFFNNLQARLPVDAANRLLGNLAHNDDLATIGTFGQELIVTKDKDFVNVATTQTSTETSSFRKTTGAYKINAERAIPQQWEALISLIPELSS